MYITSYGASLVAQSVRSLPAQFPKVDVTGVVKTGDLGSIPG